MDYSWRLAYLERFFGRYRLSEITPRLVDRFRDELAEQAHTIRLAEQRGRPVMETATDKRGRTFERRRRPLSNTSINMLITLLGQILQQAVDYELIDREPRARRWALGAVPKAGKAEPDVPRGRRVSRPA